MKALDGLQPALEHRARLAIAVLLARHGEISFAAFKEQLQMTDGNLGAQLRKLEEAGIVKGYRALLDAKALGYSLMALIYISMDMHTPERFDNFERQIRENPEVLECLMITGQDAFQRKANLSVAIR